MRNILWEFIVFLALTLLAVFIIFSVVKAVEMSASVEPNICNQNIDILKACCK